MKMAKIIIIIDTFAIKPYKSLHGEKDYSVFWCCKITELTAFLLLWLYLSSKLLQNLKSVNEMSPFFEKLL